MGNFLHKFQFSTALSWSRVVRLVEPISFTSHILWSSSKSFSLFSHQFLFTIGGSLTFSLFVLVWFFFFDSCWILSSALHKMSFFSKGRGCQFYKTSYCPARNSKLKHEQKITLLNSSMTSYLPRVMQFSFLSVDKSGQISNFRVN